jgi:hypothetical protein
MASGGPNGAPLPVAPNISSPINMGGTAGKIALVKNSDNLSGPCPLGTDPDIVDMVGYGTTANCHEGSANAPAPGNASAIFRQSAEPSTPIKTAPTLQPQRRIRAAPRPSSS